MKNNKTKIIKLIIIIIIALVVLFTIILISLARKYKNSNNEANDIKVTYSEEEDYFNIGRFFEEKSYGDLESYEEFYIAQECMNKYINYAINLKESEKAYKLLDSKYADSMKYSKFQKMYSEYKEGNYFFRANNIKSQAVSGIHIYYIDGDLVRDSKYTGIEKINDFNNLLSIDFNNDTFSIIPNIQEEKIEKYNLIKNIEKNGYNTISLSSITIEDKANNYTKYYIQEMKLDIQNAFELLNEEYKAKRFNNDIQKFNQYIQQNYYNYITFSVQSEELDALKQEIYNRYQIIDEYDEYEKIDENNIQQEFYNNNKNYRLEKSIIIEETAANTFKVLLDRYTVITDIMKEKYDGLSIEGKVAYHCENIIDSIRTQYYEYTYDHITENEKNQFPTMESYKTIFSNINLKGFYIENYQIEKNGDNYIYTGNLINNSGENKKITIGIQIGEDMNYILTTLNII